ncbi:translation initiation factor IF-5A [Candidatus Woesearchaeota archaeon]|nr:translation initiation factor IF-5A [Candidatus Woesearchaeota archaeon]
MDKKVVEAGSLKIGGYVIVDNYACTVKSIDISKPGKHGSTKCRIEAMGMIDNQKRVFIMPAHDKVEVPIIEKKNAQVLSIHDDIANVMDLESYETFDLKIPEDLSGKITEGVQVIYWNILNDKLLKQLK